MMPNIGLLNGRALHAALKRWYTRPGDRVEVALDGTLLQSHRVRLFHPIVQEKWIIRSPTPDGGHGRRRKSPKRGRLEDLFEEMVSIPQLVANRNFSLEVAMIRAEEARE